MVQDVVLMSSLENNKVLQDEIRRNHTCSIELDNKTVKGIFQPVFLKTLIGGVFEAQELFGVSPWTRNLPSINIRVPTG